VWWRATKGETYLARLSTVSPLDECRDGDLAPKYGKLLGLEVERHQSRLFTGGTKVWYEVTAVTTSAGRLELPDPIRLPEIRSEYDIAKGRLEAAIPGLELVERPRLAGETRVTIERALAPSASAGDEAVKRALDEVIGEGSYVVAPAPGGLEIAGMERVEERKISPAIMPSPREMVDALPALLNQRWSSWDDVVHWWRVGPPEGAAPRELGPLSAAGAKAAALLSDLAHGRVGGAVTRLNQLPFDFADGVYTAAIGPEWRDWKLLYALSWSTLRIVLGFFYAAIFAVPLGVVIGCFGKPRALFQPLLLIGAYLPLPAMLALTLVWWGITETQKIGFLAITTFVVLLPQVVAAIEAIPQEHLAAALTLGATRWQQMRYVLYAGAKAEIMRSLRLSFAVGWTWIILAESTDPKAGLGYVIDLGYRRPAHRPDVYAAILLIVGIAYVVNTIWAWIESKLYPYRSAES
jgi:ABC-type nitrate/sulfonate/bicarbonate transport system permease component